MEEQVYQKETKETQESLHFYDPDTKRMRGYLSEKMNLDDHNRMTCQGGQFAQYSCANITSSNFNNTNSYINSINSNNCSIPNGQTNTINLHKSSFGVSENVYNFMYGYNNFSSTAKGVEEPSKRQSIMQDEQIAAAQNPLGGISQVYNSQKKMESQMSIDNCNYFKDNVDEEPMNLQSTTSLTLNGIMSSMHEEQSTPTDLQSLQQQSQYFSISTPTLQSQESNNSAFSTQSGISIINNENICSLDQRYSASGTKQRSSGKKYNDRYIPNRVSTNLYNLINPTQSSTSSAGVNSSQQQNSDDIEEGSTRRLADNPRNEQNSKLYSNLLQSSILGESPELLQQSRTCGSSNLACILKDSALVNYGQAHTFHTQKQKKLLTYSTKSQSQNYENELKIAAHNSIVLSHEQNVRKIPKQPYKILESRNLQDDFYLNLLDWSPMNYLAVGLKNQVAIWSGCNSTISRLSGLGDVGVSSVSCSQRSNHIAVGDSIGNILIYDIQHKEQPLLKIDGHSDRIGSIAWNGSLIASGSKDKNILVRDLRAPQKCIQKYSGHKQEICGLKWSFDENILASGGNDNKLFLWTMKSKDELAKFSQHTAAVKALGFSPHQHNILASGGGTADRCIRFWNTQTLQQIDCLDTGSQVCNLMFSKNVNEIVSTHGYSLNQIIVWKYPSMKKIQTLTGHTQRVLYLAMSPCGQNVVTGAGDETLRFWNIFPSIKNKSNILGTSSLFPSCIDLR